MTNRYDSSLFQEQRTTELAESTDKIANLEFELKQAQDKLSSFEVEKSNFAAIDDQRQLTIQNMEAQERFRFGLGSRPRLSGISRSEGVTLSPSSSVCSSRTGSLHPWVNFENAKKSYQNWN